MGLVYSVGGCAVNSYAKRVDANHADIVASLRRIPGCTVMDLSAVGHGCPDIAVGFGGNNYLMEIKDGEKSLSRRQLTRVQNNWHSEWTGQVDIVKTVDEAFALLGVR